MHRRLLWLMVSITHAINIDETTLDSNLRDLAYLYRQLEYLFRSEYRQWDHPPSAADDTLVPPWDLEPLNQFPFLMAHDAATGYLDNSPEYWWAKTQTVGFGGQAACGARSFDVRPRSSWATACEWRLRSHAAQPRGDVSAERDGPRKSPS